MSHYLFVDTLPVIENPLIGGGDVCRCLVLQESGLSNSIGKAFVGFTSFPVWALVLILCVITAGFTEVTSNAAIATIFLPIFAEMVSIFR